jgi:hypothetical protein
MIVKYPVIARNANTAPPSKYSIGIVYQNGTACTRGLAQQGVLPLRVYADVQGDAPGQGLDVCVNEIPQSVWPLSVEHFGLSDFVPPVPEIEPEFSGEIHDDALCEILAGNGVSCHFDLSLLV